MNVKIKSLLFVGTFLFCITVADAQIAVKDSRFLNLGLGLGTNLYSGGGYNMQIPPLSASLEFILKDNLIDGNASIGAGGYLGFSSYRWRSGNWGWNYTSVVIGPRGNFHYQFVDKLDTYTGLLLGYNIVSSKSHGTVPGATYTASGSGLAFSWFIGGRYFFKDNLAAMAELGWGVAYLNLGICLTL
jgi:hypothetical protein